MRILLVAFLVFCGGCKKYDKTNEFLFERNEIFMSKNFFEDNGIYHPASLDIDENGNIYISDYSNCNITVFNKSHKKIRTFGRKGSGPGEFRFELQNVKVAFNRIYAKDPSGLHIFNKENKRHIITLKTNLFTTGFVINRKDSMLVMPYYIYNMLKEKVLFALIDKDGKYVKKIYSNEFNLRKTKGFGDSGSISLIGGKLYFVLGKESRIFVFDKFGDFEKEVYVKYKYYENPPAQLKKNKGAWIPFANQSLIKLTNEIYGLVFGWNFDDHYQMVCFNKELKELGRIKILPKNKGVYSTPHIYNIRGSFYGFSNLNLYKYNLDTNKLKQMLEIE